MVLIMMDLEEILRRSTNWCSFLKAFIVENLNGLGGSDLR